MRNSLGQFIKGSSGFSGVKMSQETKDKISLAKKGKPRSGDPSKWKFSNEAKEKMSKAKQGIYKDENHPGWKGDKVGYYPLHQWVVRKLGRPDSCENCDRSGLSGNQIHWANVDHKYRRCLDDWLRLCAPCHKEYDSAKN